MKPPVSFLLPGLHGTVDLFPRFVTAAPAGYRVHCQPLPSKIISGYDELADWVLERLPPEPVVLIAESFSGPLAILVADRCPRVAGVVLSATFVERPFPGFLSHVPALLWSVSPPTLFLSAMLTGGDRALAREIQGTIATVGAEVLKSRAAAALHVDVRVELARYSRPLLYLRGTRDRLIGAHSATRVRTLKPSTLVVPIDAPHMLLECRPVEAWAHIKSFVESSDNRMTG